MTEAETIAAGLTEVQRRALCYFADYWSLEEYADGRTLQALDILGDVRPIL